MAEERLQQERELEVLSELARALVTTLDTEQLAFEIVSAVGKVLNFPDCVLYLWDEPSQRLVQTAAHGPKRLGTAEILNPLRLELGEGIVGSVASERKIALVPDVSLDERYIPDLETCGSELTVPIVYQDRLQGVLDAESPLVGTFGDRESKILERFAGLCAPALVTARRFQNERRETQLLLDQTWSQYEEIVEKTSDSVYRLDTEGRLTYINPSGVKLLGRSMSELSGRRFDLFIGPASRDDFLEHLSRLRSSGQSSVTFDLPLLQPDGSSRWTELNLAPSSRAGRVQGFHAISRDVSERRDLEDRLMALANFDGVTQLFNRHRFEQEVEAQLAFLDKVEGTSALLLLDIDQFKDVNDSFGHAAGDDLLRHLGELLQREVRQSDPVARIGGDEFGVLLRSASREQAEQAAQRLVRSVHEHPFLVGPSPLRASISLGVALLPEHAESVAEALLHADLAMYAAKEAGRNGWHTFQQGDEKRDEVQARLSMVDRLRRALEQGAFNLHAQPILDLRTDRTKRYELLIRLPSEGGGLLMPGNFISVAERAGLIGEVDRWVVGRSIDLLAEIDDPEIEFEVNLSSRSLSDSQLLSDLREAVHMGRLDPRRLIFEITETAAVSDLKLAHHFIAGLQELGLRFAVDDFGVGFSSFYYLKHLPVDFLKIDGSFIRDLASNTVDQHLVRSMAEMARGLGLETIAEFVQDAATLELLREYGVDCAQGYFLGRPQSIEDLF